MRVYAGKYFTLFLGIYYSKYNIIENKLPKSAILLNKFILNFKTINYYIIS